MSQDFRNIFNRDQYSGYGEDLPSGDISYTDTEDVEDDFFTTSQNSQYLNQDALTFENFLSVDKPEKLEPAVNAVNQSMMYSPQARSVDADIELARAYGGIPSDLRGYSPGLNEINVDPSNNERIEKENEELSSRRRSEVDEFERMEKDPNRLPHDSSLHAKSQEFDRISNADVRGANGVPGLDQKPDVNQIEKSALRDDLGISHQGDATDQQHESISLDKGHEAHGDNPSHGEGSHHSNSDAVGLGFAMNNMDIPTSAEASKIGDQLFAKLDKAGDMRDIEFSIEFGAGRHVDVMAKELTDRWSIKLTAKTPDMLQQMRDTRSQLESSLASKLDKRVYINVA